MKYKVTFLLVAFLGAVIDILTKYWAWSAIPDGDSISVISGVLALRKTTNTGIIFGAFQGFGDIFLIVSIAAVPIIVAVFLSAKKGSWLFTISLGLILSGAFGNMFDRIFEKGVRDFIDFYIIRWPVFNLADSFICIGASLLFIYLFFIEREEKSSESGSGGCCAITQGQAQSGKETPLNYSDKETFPKGS